MLILIFSLWISSTALAGECPTDFAKGASRAPAESLPPGALAKITQEDYNAFPTVMGTRPVKFVLLPDGKGEFSRLFVIDPRQHEFHWQFLSTLPEFKGMNVHDIKALSFEPGNRRVLLGTLTTENGMSEGQWNPTTSFFLNTSEAPEPALVRKVGDTVGDWLEKNADANTGVGNLGTKLGFEPTLAQQPAVAARLKDYRGITVHMPYANKSAAAYNEGVGLGRIVVANTAKEVEAGLKNGTINADTILVVGEDLLELPPVAGVISAQPMTEASHLVLLAQMYSMPLAYEPGALKTYGKLKGQWAVMETREGSGFELFPSLSEGDLARVRSVLRQPSLKVEADFAESRIREVTKLEAKDVKSYGGKSAKFGLIRRTIPEATRAKVLGIPIHYYRLFLETSKLPDGRSVKAALDQIMGRLPANASYFETVAAAKEARAMMKTAELDPKLVADLRQTLEREFPEAKRLKLRSSSNVEDGAEFNGAGLYDSDGICLRECEKDDFAKGLRKVWSSLYTERGLWARRRFGVDEKLVGMGITVHPPYKGEAANGVVKFARRARYEGEDEIRQVKILAVSGEEASVTNATEGGVNEVVAIEGDRVDFHRPANGEPPGRFLMERKHYDQLSALMEKLYRAWPHSLKGMEIEAEWKLVGTGADQHVEIKQVRIVPRPAATRLGEGEFIVAAGDDLSLVGAWADDVDSILARPEKVSLPLGREGMQPLREGKPPKAPVKITIGGKEFELKAGRPVASREDGYEKIELPLTPLDPKMPGYRPIKIVVTMSRGDGSGVLTPSSPNFRVTLEAGSRDDGFQFTRYDLPTADKEAELLRRERRPRKHVFEREGCPVKVKAQSTHRFLRSDNEFRYLGESVIQGVLNRPLRVSGYPSALYFKQLHEGREEALFDLFADPSLTGAEKKEITRRTGGARYLKAYSFSFAFLDSSLKAVEGMAGCGESFADQDDGGAE